MHGTVRPPRAAGALRACVGLLAAWAVVGASCEPSLHTVRVASGLAAPVYLTAPPGDARLFVVERAGTIRIVEGGTVLATPFLDIRSLVGTEGEAGLLGLAFPDDYAGSGCVEMPPWWEMVLPGHDTTMVCLGLCPPGVEAFHR